MARIELDVGADDDVVTEGVFVCHLMNGEGTTRIKTVAYNEPTASAQIGMLTQVLDRIRNIQARKWIG